MHFMSQKSLFKIKTSFCGALLFLRDGETDTEFYEFPPLKTCDKIKDT